MNHNEVGKCWNENAKVWTKLARAGYDIYRDYLNTPAFFEMLPDINGLAGLDIGCGEGYNTRLLAKQALSVTAIDISDVFISYAQEKEDEYPLGIKYKIASAADLPFENNSFDFVTGFMSFMDIPETEKVLAEAFRVLKPNGFLQFSIEHPCFSTHYRENLRNDNGRTYAIAVGDYFYNPNGEITEWIFSSTPKEIKQSMKKFKVPKFTHTISEWLNLLINTGFVLEEIREPRPTDEIVKKCPQLQDAQVVSYFFHVKAKKIN